MKMFIKRRPTLTQVRKCSWLLTIATLLLNPIICDAQSPQNSEGWVVLPVDEYHALRLAAFPAERPPDPSPIEATLTRIDYELKVDGEIAVGEARLTIDVIKDGWVRVAIPSGLMINQAKLDDKPVSLIADPEKGDGLRYVLLSRAGRSVLTLGLAARVTVVAGTEMLKLPIGAAAISRASVVVQRRGVDARITGGLLLEKSESANESRWVAYGKGSETLTFAWRRRADDQRSTQPLKFRGVINQLVGLGEDTTQINAEVQVDVLQGLASEIRLHLPDNLTVNQVSGATVADWESKTKELVVTFLEPVGQSTRFTLSGDLKLPRDGEIDIPLVRLISADREAGSVGVEVLGAAEIKDRKSTGLEETDASDLAQLIASRQAPSLIAFRMRPAEGTAQRSLSLNIARYTPQAVLTANIEEARYNTLVTEDGKMLVQARLAVRNNQRNFLKINLPTNATLWSALVAGRPVRPGRAPDGSLLIPLQKGKSGEEAPGFVVEITYLDHVPAWTEKGRARITLLGLDLPISKSEVLIHHSPAFRLTPVAGSFRSATYEAPGSALQSGSASAKIAESSDGADAGSKALGRMDPGNLSTPLVSQLHKSSGSSRPMRLLPTRVSFPHFGPSIFLVSELTSESQSPVIEIDFQREKKRGER